MRGLVVGAVLVIAGSAAAAPVATVEPIGPNIEPYLHGAPLGELQYGTIYVANTGDAPLHVTNVALSGSGAAVFAFESAGCTANSCPQPLTLAPGAGTNLILSCTAAQFGDTVATVTVTSDAAPATGTIACTGLRPPTVSVTPSSLDFGRVHACNAFDGCGGGCDGPTTRTVTITNTAPAPSELLFLVPDLGDDWQYTRLGCIPSHPCVIEAGDSYTFTMTFAPKNGSGPTWTFDLTAPQVDQPAITVPLTAIGGWGRLDITPPVVHIGSAPIGQTTTVPWTVTNIGDACLEVHTPELLDPDFHSVGTDPQVVTIAAGGTYTWHFDVTPHATSISSSTILLEYDHHLVDFHLMNLVCDGTGSALAPDLTAIDFADAVPVGASGVHLLSLTNELDHEIQVLSLTSSDPRFTVALASGTLPANLVPGAKLQLLVTFRPDDDSDVSATLAVHASETPDALIALTGRGTPPGPGTDPDPDPDPDPGHGGGGCATGSPALLIGLALLALRRRRP